jgi:hypothetical protein
MFSIPFKQKFIIFTFSRCVPLEFLIFSARKLVFKAKAIYFLLAIQNYKYWIILYNDTLFQESECETEFAGSVPFKGTDS